MTPTQQQPVTPVRRQPATVLARVVTEALAPAVLVASLMLAVGWHTGRTGGSGLLWGLAAAAFASLIPFAYIVHNVRTGRVTDHHLGVRQQRRLPLLVGIGSVTVGTVLLSVFHAPRELLAVIVAGGAGLMVSLVISHWWKMSVHSAVAAGTVVVLALVFGPVLLVAAPLVALVAWSRVQLRDHTPVQVVVGAIVGALVAYSVFTLVR